MNRAEAIVEARLSEGLPLLKRVARRVFRRGGSHVLDFDELVSVGYVGLRKAAQKFDPDRGTPFLSFAWLWIEGEMKHEVRKQKRLSERARWAGRQAVTLLDDEGDVMQGDDTAHRATLRRYMDAVAAAMLAGAVGSATAASLRTHETEAEDVDARAAEGALAQALSKLAPSEETLLKRHYLQDMTLRDIAQDRGVSYATIRRHHNAALSALGEAMRSTLDTG